MKELLCQAFCASLDVRKVPVGYAVRTPYDNADGDPLLLYFVRQQGLGAGEHWRIEDDGTQVALLEANGVDLSGKARGEAFDALLKDHSVVFDKASRTLVTPTLSQTELGAAAVRFSALLLRLQDLALLSPQIVRNTFREDALAALHSAFDRVAEIRESEPLDSDLIGQEADVVIRAQSSSPIGIFFATSEERALQALIAKMEAEKYRGLDVRVVLMVERAKANPVRETTFSLALARLDGVVSFREAQLDTMQRLSKMAGLPDLYPERLQ